MTSGKTLCPHGWTEPLQPCPACTMDQSVCDAMDASRTEPLWFTGLGGIPVIEDKNIPEGKAFVFGVDLANGPDQSVEIKYQLKDEGVEVTSITDKPDTKNTRDDWFNPFCGVYESIDPHKAIAVAELHRENNRMVRVIADRDTEIRVLRQACKAAGDEIRELHAQRKPEQHGAYWLTFPECGTSRGMYWAMAGLLAAGGLLLAWCFA